VLPGRGREKVALLHVGCYGFWVARALAKGAGRSARFAQCIVAQECARCPETGQGIRAARLFGKDAGHERVPLMWLGELRQRVTLPWHVACNSRLVPAKAQWKSPRQETGLTGGRAKARVESSSACAPSASGSCSLHDGVGLGTDTLSRVRWRQTPSSERNCCSILPRCPSAGGRPQGSEET
jgi:hypothetical protein